jgi:DNA-binding NarL/FixJ family response regulator
MYAPNSAVTSHGGEPNGRLPEAHSSGRRGALLMPRDAEATGTSAKVQTVVYLDPRAFTRDCVGGWLQRNMAEFGVRVLADLDQIETARWPTEEVRAIVINVGPDRVTSATITRLGELWPGVAVAVLSDHEDPESIRAAFHLGVRGFIPTSLASMVAAEAVRLVVVGGTFAPAAALLRNADQPQPAGEPEFDGFTQRQSQILECLQRGMANKLIAYELNMCESTVKVHIRNIMKKLKATNRTQVAYMTRRFFQSAIQHRPPAS